MVATIHEVDNHNRPIHARQRSVILLSHVGGLFDPQNGRNQHFRLHVRFAERMVVVIVPQPENRDGEDNFQIQMHFVNYNLHFFQF